MDEHNNNKTIKAEYKTKDQKRRFYNSKAWKVLRREALKRDRYECTWCSAKGKVTTKEHVTLEVDHIKEIEYYPEHALDLDLVRTLCRNCHNVRHGRHKLNVKESERKKKWDDESFD